MPISDLCSEKLVTIEKGATLQFAASQMKKQHVGSVVVIESEGKSERPIGVLTDRDIVLKAVAENLDMNTARVGDVMSRNPITMNKDAGVYEAVKVMQQRGVRRLLVVDEAKHLCGLLSADDLVEMIGDEMSRIGSLFETQRRDEKRYHPESDQPTN